MCNNVPTWLRVLFVTAVSLAIVLPVLVIIRLKTSVYVPAIAIWILVAFTCVGVFAVAVACFGRLLLQEKRTRRTDQPRPQPPNEINPLLVSLSNYNNHSPQLCNNTSEQHPPPCNEMAKPPPYNSNESPPPAYSSQERLTEQTGSEESTSHPPPEYTTSDPPLPELQNPHAVVPYVRRRESIPPGHTLPPQLSEQENHEEFCNRSLRRRSRACPYQRYPTEVPDYEALCHQPVRHPVQPFSQYNLSLQVPNRPEGDHMLPNQSLPQVIIQINSDDLTEEQSEEEMVPTGRSLSLPMQNVSDVGREDIRLPEHILAIPEESGPLENTPDNHLNDASAESDGKTHETVDGDHTEQASTFPKE